MNRKNWLLGVREKVQATEIGKADKKTEYIVTEEEIEEECSYELGQKLEDRIELNNHEKRTKSRDLTVACSKRV